jgi:hypothetical protein
MLLNLGIVSHKLSNNLTEGFNEINVKNNIINFVKIITESEILSKEFLIIKNLEEKYIGDENKAVRYIDENISMFDDVKYVDLIKEHKKLETLELPNITVDYRKEKLYESIQNLLIQNTIRKGIKSVDVLHESFEYILDYIKTNICTNEIMESAPTIEHDDLYLKILVDKYNNTYGSLDENEKNIIISLINESDISIKEITFNKLLNETTNKIVLKLNEDIYSDDEIAKLNETQSKLLNYKFDSNNYTNDVMKIFSLYSCL